LYKEISDYSCIRGINKKFKQLLSNIAVLDDATPWPLKYSGKEGVGINERQSLSIY